MGVNVTEAAPAPAEAEQLKLGVVPSAAASQPASVAEMATVQNQEDAPPCSVCGSIMVRSGSCYKCVNCGSTSGCA
jgi:ribonucleoside-diphosphate reductase alpha chain